MTEFLAWSKTPRYFRDIVITEKIDGTNAAVVIEEHPAYDEQSPDLIEVVAGDVFVGTSSPATEFHVFAQSRKRLITPASDNHGFATWVRDNATTLVRDLGAGRHFGEWWGRGIQRKYGLDRKVFSLFNVKKWNMQEVPFATPNLTTVPIIYQGEHREDMIRTSLAILREHGSYAAMYFGRWNEPAEGICVYHTAANQVFKVTLENDEAPKSLVEPKPLVAA